MNTTTIPTELARPERVANAPARGLRSDLRIALQQIGFEQRAFWRNRTRAFFSVAFPLMFLVVFNAINSGDHISRLGGISYATWFVPGILAYGIIMATFSNLAISTAIARDNGVLKRMRGTPIPTWVFMAGTIGSTLLTALLLVGCTLGLGAAAYGVTIRGTTLLGLFSTLALGTICFTTLGLAVTAAIPNADAAPAIVNAIVLPLTFISGIWMVTAGGPTWISTVAKIFPVRALAHGLQYAFDPSTRGNGVSSPDLQVLALWTAIGLRLFAKRFRWVGGNTH